MRQGYLVVSHQLYIVQQHSGSIFYQKSQNVSNRLIFPSRRPLFLQKQQVPDRTSLRKFKVSHFLSICARGVPQHCRRTTLNTTFRPLIFSRTLQNLAPATGGTRVFRKKSRIQSARSRFTRHMDPKNGEKQGVKGQKQKEN